MANKYFYTVTLLEAKKYIEKSFPNLLIKDIELSGEGFDNIAYLINKKYIFLFSKRKHAAKQLKIEIKLLENLRNILSVEIPNFEFIGKHIKSFPFVGYKKIEGRLLEKESFYGFNDNKMEMIIKQLSKIITDLHSFPIVKAKLYGVRTTDFKKKYENEFKATKEQIYPIVKKETKEYLNDLFTQYLSNNENFNYIPSLIHADLNPSHILYDLKKAKIKGIIDFGDVQIGDPDFDLEPLYNTYGKNFLKKFLKFYKITNKKQLLLKLEFFKKYKPLQEIFAGLRESDSELQRGLKKLRKKVKIWKQNSKSRNI